MIQAEHLVKSFDGRTVLDDITVGFDTGKTNLIIGRSGSGKTVLLKCLVGLHEIDSGRVRYDDTDFTHLGFRERKAIRRDIGMIFQGGALLGKDVPPFVVVRNDTLRFAGVNKIGLSRRDFTQQRIDEIHEACRILFQSGLNYMNGCDEVERTVPQSPDRDQLLEFIRTSQRGIIKPYASNRE